jgi:hypothetical protein
MDRKGMELAINTIVMLILGIAILGIVIWLATTIGGGGEDMIEVTESTKEDLFSQQRCSSSLQSSGLCVYPRSQTVSKGETAAYLLWVSNNFQNNISKVEITKTSECSNLKGLYSQEDEFVIEDIIKPGNDGKIYPAFVNPDAGTCSFKVEVRDSDNNVVATETFFLKTK